MSEEKKTQVEEVFDAAKKIFDDPKTPSWTGFPTPGVYGQPTPPWPSPYVAGESEWVICTQHKTTAGIIPTVGMFNTLIIKEGDKCTISVQIKQKQVGYGIQYGGIPNNFDATVVSVTPDELKLQYRDDIAGVMREVTYTPDKFFNPSDEYDIRIASCKIKPYGMPIY